MEQTALLKIILQKADAIKNEYGSPRLYASHIAAAVADFCKAPYTGLFSGRMAILLSELGSHIRLPG